MHALEDEPWWPLSAIGIVGTFMLAGPPIGGVASWVVLSLATYQGFGRDGWAFLLGFVLYSYRIGGAFALASGVLHAFAGLRLRRYSLDVPLAISVLVVVIGVGVRAWLARPGFDRFLELRSGLLLFGPASLAGSLACWALTRRLARTAKRKTVAK